MLLLKTLKKKKKQRKEKKKKRENKKFKKIKKLMKMIMEAIILMISWHYYTIKMRNNSKTKHVEKKIVNLIIIVVMIMT